LLFARRRGARRALLLRRVALAFRTLLLPARCGLAALSFFVKTFCTASAFAAMVPSVAPIDAATLVKSGSFLKAFWLSTA
jgi:hypothetical protein